MASIPSKAIEAVGQLELTKASTLFNTLKQLRTKLKTVDEGILDKAFEIHVQSLLEKLEGRLSLLGGEELKSVEIIMARHGLYDAAFQQIILLCQSSKEIFFNCSSDKSVSPALGDSLKDLRAIHSGFMTDLQQAICGFVDRYEDTQTFCNKQREQIAALESELDIMRDTIKQLDEEAEAQNQKILGLRQHLREAAQEINFINSSGGNQGNTSSVFNFTSNSLPIYGEPSPKLSKSNLNASTQSLTSSLSPHYLSKLKRNDISKTSFRLDESMLHDESKHHGPNPGVASGSTPSVAGSQHGTRSAGGSVHSGANYRIGASHHSGLNTPTKGSLSIVAPVNWLHVFRVDIQKAIDDGKCREITLHECKETIERVYQSKVVANEKAMQGVGNLPMETMEQHTYRTMEKKYGLRALAVEHVGMLLKAVERYAEEDMEVLIFQKILRNEIEEDYRFIHSELQNSIRDLTMIQIMGKYPTKDQATLQELLEQRLTSGVISETEWNDMLHYLYNETDHSILHGLLKEEATRDVVTPVVETMNSTLSQLTLNISRIPSKVPVNTSVVIGTSGTLPSASEIRSSMGYDKGNFRDVKRLGYSSPTLKVALKDPSQKVKKEVLKLPYPVFIRIVLDFQLSTHQQYLMHFIKLFRQFDKDVDGVLNAAEFRDCYFTLKHDLQAQLQLSSSGSVASQRDDEVESMNTFISLIKALDPLETDRIIFSSAVTCLNKFSNKPQHT